MNLGGTQEKSQPRVAPLEPLLWKGYLERETGGGGGDGDGDGRTIGPRADLTGSGKNLGLYLPKKQPLESHEQSRDNFLFYFYH